MTIKVYDTFDFSKRSTALNLRNLIQNILLVMRKYAALHFSTSCLIEAN